MISLKRKESGFTIVELLIVIVVIGILAALVVTTFAGIQRKARNTERETDIKAIHGQLEAYFAQNNSYPADGAITETFVASDLKGLDTGSLQDPKGNSKTLLASDTPTATQYAYNASPDGCTTQTDTAAGTCTSYLLRALVEGGSGTEYYEKRSLN